MTEIDEAITRVNDAEDRRDAAQSAALQRVADDVTDLRSTVDQLRAQINNGGDGAIQTARALDAVVARIEASTAQLQGVDPVPDAPAPGDDTTGDDTTGGDVTPGGDVTTPGDVTGPTATDDVVVDGPVAGDFDNSPNA